MSCDVELLVVWMVFVGVVSCIIIFFPPHNIATLSPPSSSRHFRLQFIAHRSVVTLSVHRPSPMKFPPPYYFIYIPCSASAPLLLPQPLTYCTPSSPPTAAFDEYYYRAGVDVDVDVGTGETPSEWLAYTSQITFSPFANTAECHSRSPPRIIHSIMRFSCPFRQVNSNR